MSILETNPSLHFNVYIIYSGFGEHEHALMHDLIKNHTCSLHFLPVSDDEFDRVITKGRQTKVVYYNLLIPKWIDEDRILYLDVDLVVNGDITPIYDADFEDGYVIGVEDWKLFDRHEELGMASDAKYFNNGAMVLNLKKMRDENFSQRYFDYINEAKELKFLDQDVINAVVNGRWKQMPLKYNSISSYLRHSFLKNDYFSKEWITEAFHHPVIIHFTGGRKPWHYKSGSRFRYLYWKYLAMTPFASYREPDRTVINQIKKSITTVSKKLQGKF
jgi:lipopolysaccharide biosynthesis glycosyltransferase